MSPTEVPAPYEYTAYYPSNLKVHRGDTVRWDFPGDNADRNFHTVTFVDDEADLPDLWRTDDLPGTMAMSQRAAFGSGCGRGTAAPCTFTGGYLSSGTPAFQTDGNGFTSPFRATMDVPPGRYSYFCTIHGTMRGTVEVVPDDALLDNPTSTEIADQIAADTADADALRVAMSTPQPPVEVNGGRLWTVYTGAQTTNGRVHLLQFLPPSINVAPGDSVRFLMPSGAPDGLHTVTFPARVQETTPAQLNFYPACDVDDPTTGAPSLPGVFLVCPGELEVLLAPWMSSATRSPADAVLTPDTYHDSGILASSEAAGRIAMRPDRPGERWGDTFEASFPAAGTFTYTCNVHPKLMPASVVVA